MKKICAFFYIAFLAFAITGCGNTVTSGNGEYVSLESAFTEAIDYTPVSTETEIWQEAYAALLRDYNEQYDGKYTSI